MFGRVFIAPFVRGPVKTPHDPRLSLAYRVIERPVQCCNAPLGSAVNAGRRVSGADCSRLEAVDPRDLQAADIVLVDAGQCVPADGVILQGAASIDESAVTGQSAPVLRESGGVAEVMRGTCVVFGRIIVEVAPRRGHSLDWISAPDNSLSPPHQVLLLKDQSRCAARAITTFD